MWEARVADLRQKFAERKVQVSLVRFLSGNARIYLKDSFPGQIIEEVGLQRPPQQAAAGFAQEVSLEQIPQMNGDVLFYFTDVSYDGGQSASDLAQPWLTHPLWLQLEVVQKGKAYPVSDVV